MKNKQHFTEKVYDDNGNLADVVMNIKQKKVIDKIKGQNVGLVHIQNDKFKIADGPSDNMNKKEAKQNKNKQNAGKLSDREKLSKLGFAHIGMSQLTIWHKPSIKVIYLLKDLLGITMIVSVQKDIENPQAIAEACSQLDIKHTHIPLDGANQEYLGDKQV